MKQKIWAIGDIHGCYNEMMAIMSRLKDAGLDEKRDIVVFLGDYIDRGPDSKKVVAQLIDWHKKYPQWVFIFGNHEHILWDYLRNDARQYGQSNWMINGGKTTMKSYGGHFGHYTATGDFVFPQNPLFPPEHLDFLFNQTQYTFETDDYFFVHGGVVPTATLEESKNYLDTLIWARDGFIESSWDWGKFIIFGHTADSEGIWAAKPFYPIMLEDKCGLDCAVCPPSSKRLAAIELPDKTIHLIESKTYRYSTQAYAPRNWRAS